MARPILRRDFLKTSATVATGAVFSTGVFGNVGRVRAASPNGKLRTAHVGVGGMGGADLKSISTHASVEVAALCDEVVVIAHGAVVAAGTTASLLERAGESGLEDAFVKLIGSAEGLA